MRRLERARVSSGVVRVGLWSKAQVGLLQGAIPHFLERLHRGLDPPFPQKYRGSTGREGVIDCGALDFRHIATGINFNRDSFEP